MVNVIKKIFDNWDTEASNEDADKYFFNYTEVDTILTGKKCFVIGRKGTGKTAICHHIEQINTYDSFTAKLSFKNFPFNLLYNCPDLNYQPKHRYITVWMELIYMNICKMFIKNESISQEIRDKLKTAFPHYIGGKLESEVKNLKNYDVHASLTFPLRAGGEVGVKVENSPAKTDTPFEWTDNVSILEDIIHQYCDESKYYLVFDELDEDYSDIYSDEYKDKYLPLLTGLLKAVQKIRAEFKDRSIFPVVFLRDDIYKQIKDPDKTKWDSQLVHLKWDVEKLKSLLAYRISKDIGKERQPFNDAWNNIVSFYGRTIKYGNNKIQNISTADYMFMNTHLRPRDVVKYLICCSGHALENQRNYLNISDFKYANSAFSESLRGELEDELQAIIPNIEMLWRLLSDIRKQIFTYDEFKAHFLEYKSSFPEYDEQSLLDVLFNFSIVGNQDRADKNKYYYKYQEMTRSFSKYLPIVIHKGLLKTLQIS